MWIASAENAKVEWKKLDIGIRRSKALLISRENELSGQKRQEATGLTGAEAWAFFALYIVLTFLRRKLSIFVEIMANSAFGHPLDKINAQRLEDHYDH